METINSVKDIDLSPKRGKTYTNIERSWSKDIIYFLIVDRFHDALDRSIDISENGPKGFGKAEELNNFYGGTIKGVTKHLDYIKDLGCTAIWITPVFENNPTSYHGYAIQNFLTVDPRFGSKNDLIELVDEAHKREIKVILDVVINHTGDNWYYYPDKGYRYTGTSFRFGGFRRKDRPLPVELQNASVYYRKGSIQNWDKYPETIEGDFFNLKKLRLDESEVGVLVLDLMVKIYSYWLRECDFDGFRMDAAKHIGPFGLNYFTWKIKEYAKQLGKKDFMVMAEVAGDDDTVVRYCKHKSSAFPEIYSPDAFLDFPLHYILPEVIKGNQSSDLFWDRIESLETVSDLVGKNISRIIFLDNHDQIASSKEKKRIGVDFSDEELSEVVGLLYCLPGIPCLYYGTEQGLRGKGDRDHYIRESMFSNDKNGQNQLNTKSIVYKKINEISKIRQSLNELSEGTISKHRISFNGTRWNDQGKEKSPIVFSRECSAGYSLVIFNTDKQVKEFYIDLKNDRIWKNYRCVMGKDKLKEITEIEKSAERIVKVKTEGFGLIILRAINF